MFEELCVPSPLRGSYCLDLPARDSIDTLVQPNRRAFGLR